MLRALFVAAVLAVSSPAFAQAPEAELKAAELAMQKFARTAQEFEAIIVEAAAVADRTLARVDEAGALAERKASAGEIERWSDGWTPQMRRDIDALELRLKNTPPIDTSELEKMMGSSSIEYMRIARMARDLRDGATEALTGIEDLCETIATLAPKAATGDEEAMLRLGLSMIEGARTMIQVESISIERSIGALPDGHPQYFLLSSVKASNQGVMHILDAAVAEILDDGFDRKAAVAKIRAAGQEARENARRIPEAAATMLTEVRNSEVGGSDLARRIERGFANYPQAAKVEERLADIILSAATSLEKKGDLLERLDAEIEGFEPLSEERARLDSERRSAIAD